MTVTLPTVKRVPMESWMATRIGVSPEDLTREHIRQFQQQKLQDTIRWASKRSPFYRSYFKGIAHEDIACQADLSRFPFTTAAHIQHHGLRFLCVSQDEISRVVTLDTSGTTGPAKRLYFTIRDQELTVQFFRYGMEAMAAPGDRVLILLPGNRPGSVGDLLATALRSLGAIPYPYGAVRDIQDALAVITREEVNILVGIPAQVFALTRYVQMFKQDKIRLKAILLSTDHAPRSIIQELEHVWKCDVFEHYGMTEMGLGGGTVCAAHEGYHLHETDFLFEIVHPVTGEQVPDGEEGEVVVTTLTRQGMPLIRYRTGDLSRFLPELCRCGSRIRRLSRITARTSSTVLLGNGQGITMADLDEVLFLVNGVVGFSVYVNSFCDATKLTVAVITSGVKRLEIEVNCLEALCSIGAIKRARSLGNLTVKIVIEECSGILVPTVAKRTIQLLDESSDG